jgi:Ion channel
VSVVPSRLASLHRSHRYAILFYILLVALAASPLLTALGFGADLLQIVLAFSLFVALIEVPGRGRMLLLLVAAVAVGLRIVPASTVGAEGAIGALAAVSVLALFAVARTIRFALRAREIDAERIYAALSAYVLAGLFFGVLYWTIEAAWPGSFGEAGADGARGAFSLSTAIYYSFVTLATLGYGDVVPRTEVARGVAVLEAVGGQLYIAVTIARLVSAQRPPAGSGDEDPRR